MVNQMVVELANGTTVEIEWQPIEPEALETAQQALVTGLVTMVRQSPQWYYKSETVAASPALPIQESEAA